MKQAKKSVWLVVTTVLLLCLSCAFTIDPSAEKEERERITEVRKRLEANPSLINAPSGPEGSPLHFAVLKNSMSLVRWLFAHGADANVRDSSGETPLHGAVI